MAFRSILAHDSKSVIVSWKHCLSLQSACNSKELDKFVDKSKDKHPRVPCNGGIGNKHSPENHKASCVKTVADVTQPENTENRKISIFLQLSMYYQVNMGTI